jgi:hypothetical protein
VADSIIRDFRYVRQAIVTVLVPPKFTKRPHLDKPVNEGTELELPCSASGFPIPTVEWTYNGQPITTTTATISINAGTLKIGPVTTQVGLCYKNLEHILQRQKFVSTMLHFKAGVSNSNVLEGHITKKKCSAGRSLLAKKTTFVGHN